MDTWTVQIAPFVWVSSKRTRAWGCCRSVTTRFTFRVSTLGWGLTLTALSAALSSPESIRRTIRTPFIRSRRSLLIAAAEEQRLAQLWLSTITKPANRSPSSSKIWKSDCDRNHRRSSETRRRMKKILRRGFGDRCRWSLMTCGRLTTTRETKYSPESELLGSERKMEMAKGERRRLRRRRVQWGWRDRYRREDSTSRGMIELEITVYPIKYCKTLFLIDLFFTVFSKLMIIHTSVQRSIQWSLFEMMKSKSVHYFLSTSVPS